MHREPQPVKLYAVASMYRYAAPQRGSTASTGSSSVEAIGSRTCRRRRADPALRQPPRARRRGVPAAAELDRRSRVSAAYVERLEAWLDEHADELDDEAREKRATSPLRVFDVKNERTRALLADAPTIGESLCDACSALRLRATVPRRVRRPVRAGSDARAGARLLHANDVRVHPRDARPRGRRRRALRLPRRGARRPSTPGIGSRPESSASSSPFRKPARFGAARATSSSSSIPTPTALPPLPR